MNQLFDIIPRLWFLTLYSLTETDLADIVEFSKVKTSGLTKVFPSPIVRPSTVVLQFSSEVLPLRESIVGKLNARCIADTGKGEISSGSMAQLLSHSFVTFKYMLGIQMGRSFRAGWGPGLTLVSLSTQKRAAVVPLHAKFSQLGSYVSGRLLDDTTSSIVQRLQIVGGRGGDADYVETFKVNLTAVLLDKNTD